MPFTFTLPNEYGYVLLTAAASTFISQWHAINTGRYRRAAKIPYPNAYASAAEALTSREKYLFNCAQRAHVSFLENYPSMLVGMLVGGLQYPVWSAGMGAAWCVARVVYALGYVSQGKEGKWRVAGGWYWFPQMGLGVLGGLVGWNMLGL